MSDKTQEKQLHFSIGVAWSESDGEFVATSAEFPGLSGLGVTVEDAVRVLGEAMHYAVAALVEDGEAVPEPRLLTEFSGQFRLRLPKSQHAELASRAQTEGVSLNTLAQHYISAGLASDRLASSTTQRLDAAVRQIEYVAVRRALELSNVRSANSFMPADGSRQSFINPVLH